MKKIILNKEQKKYTKGIKWLFFGKRMRGATFLLNYLGIEEVRFKLIGKENFIYL